MELSPRIRIQRLNFGRERLPLVVIDDVLDRPEELVNLAASKHYLDPTQFYPGIRAKAPLSYQELIVQKLRDTLIEHFEWQGQRVRFTMCHFSLVTTPPGKLVLEQRIPHVDSLAANGLASIHYLFSRDLGGTAFYRHRSTGYEYIDETRKAAYIDALKRETAGEHAPPAEYINGDTPLFEQVARQDGVFNRMLIYRRNSLHSGSIAKHFVPDPNPRTGRLSINSFIDLES